METAFCELRFREGIGKAFVEFRLAATGHDDVAFNAVKQIVNHPLADHSGSAGDKNGCVG